MRCEMTQNHMGILSECPNEATTWLEIKDINDAYPPIRYDICEQCLQQMHKQGGVTVLNPMNGNTVTAGPGN